MKEIREGLKELVRTALLAAIPLVISQIQTETIDYKAITIAIVIAVLSGIDKMLHKMGKGVLNNGLTGI